MADAPDISLVIPAWNEAAYLPRLLDSVDAARARHQPPGASGAGASATRRIEVIVADNGSTDTTAQIAAERGCRVAPVAKRAIAAARNGGAAIAAGRILAFADADLVIHPDTFNFIASAMSTPGVVGGSTGLVMERSSLGINVSYWVALGTLIPAGFDGGVCFCRRADFVALGGDNEDRRYAEDVAFMSALRRVGAARRPREQFLTRIKSRRLGMTPPLAINSCRKFETRGQWHIFGLAWKAFVSPRVVQRYWYEGRG